MKKYFKQVKDGMIHVYVVQPGLPVLHMNVTHPLINILGYDHYTTNVEPYWESLEITLEQFLEYRDQVLRAFDLI